jgi:hypothetical protein
MYTHPYLAMTLANDRADRLCAAVLAHRLVRTTRERRHADRIRRGYQLVSPMKPGQRGSRLSAPLAVSGAS